MEKTNGKINNPSITALNNSDLRGIFSLFSDKDLTVLPGFCDVHVHFREPGFSYKETIETGSMAAARGGYTTVCTMPNLKPVPDSLENLKLQLNLIDKCNLIKVVPFGSITKGEMGEELSEMQNLAPFVAGFSDDGRGVQNEEIMYQAMLYAKSLDKIIVAHAEDNTLLFGGYINEGEYQKANGHKGICSESEWRQIERDLYLVEQTGVKYHVCHVSTLESVELLRDAKKSGLDVTAETAPHYLTLCDKDLIEDGRFKMNPPLRSEKDKNALIQGVIDGTIDMIATDHAPHSLEEKSKGLKGSLMGVVGLETAFPILYTKLVKENIIDLEKLIKVMCYNPRQRFNLTEDEGFSVWDLNEKYTIDPKDFLSMGKSTPFKGEMVYGKNYLTVLNGKTVFKEKI